MLNKSEASINSQLDPALVDRIATRLTELGLDLPAKFFLEAHIPIFSLVHNAGIFLEPFALPLFGADRIEIFREFFSNRENAEALLARLEERTVKKISPSQALKCNQPTTEMCCEE